jgi:hypothetical protein
MLLRPSLAPHATYHVYQLRSSQAEKTKTHNETKRLICHIEQQRPIRKAAVHFVIDSVRELLDTPSNTVRSIRSTGERKGQS